MKKNALEAGDCVIFSSAKTKKKCLESRNLQKAVVVVRDSKYPLVGVRFVEEPKRTVWACPHELTLVPK